MTMNAATRADLIIRYREGPLVLAAAAAGAYDAELDSRPLDGGWTARQIIHHTADSEMTSAIRLRRLIAEDNPALGAYDEELFARRLHYDRPIAASLAATRAARESTAEILDRLSDSDWRRAGRHPEHDSYTVEDWLQIYAAHCHEHADQLRKALRSPLGG